MFRLLCLFKGRGVKLHILQHGAILIRNGDYYEKDKAIAVSASGCTDADLLHPAERMGS